MSLELHQNDISREAHPGIWIFTGKYPLMLLVAGAMLFIAIFRALAAIDIDWWLNIVISLLPLAAISVVLTLLRGKPPSYANDMLLLWIWRMKTNLYMMGGLERPPLLWLENKVEYPKNRQ